ncbi:TPA_asm: TetR/AcrR family transcriptional regulator [Listeria monocytogenes]|nr:TetR/AcrR family transcriptional regulator [Listeria monocytogenes]
MVKTTNNIFVLLDRSDKMKMHDPRYRRAEDTIIDTFLHLLRQNSFDSISINELTKKANINRSTFYSHYEDKNHLLKTVIKTSLHNYLEIHTINNFLFGEEFIWSILVQTRDFVESISKEWGKGFLSIIMQIDMYIREYLYDIIYDKLMLSSYAKENPERRYLAVSLSASIFSVIRETHIKQVKLDDMKFNLLPMIYTF